MTPKIHLFNPGHETAVFHGSVNYTPPTNVQRMIKELVNGEIGYGTEFYSRQKERTISKYADLKDTLNDVLNYKKEEDFISSS